MSDCIFCKLANKEIKTDIIAENEQAVVFADRSPRAPVHLLIVPKKHIVNINDLEDGDQAVTWAMLQLAQQVARTHGGDDHSFNLVANNGSAAGQVVFHMHWHFMAGKDLSLTE